MQIFGPLKRFFSLLRNNLDLLQEAEELRNLLQIEIEQAENLRLNLATTKSSLAALADERDTLRTSLRDASTNAKIFSVMVDDAEERAIKAEQTVDLLNRQLNQRTTQLERVGDLILNQHPYHKILEQLKRWTVVVGAGDSEPIEGLLTEADLAENEELAAERRGEQL